VKQSDCWQQNLATKYSFHCTENYDQRKRVGVVKQPASSTFSMYEAICLRRS
jgi:hypothetical protein